MSRHHSPHIVTDGLVLYLDAANPKSYVSGSTTWHDLSKNSNIGTLINGTTFNSGNGGSIVFDGVNDCVKFGNILNMATNNFTLSAWVKSSSTSVVNNNGIFYKKTTNYSYNAGYRLNMPNGSFNLTIADGTNYETLTSTLSTYNDNQWHNVIAVIHRANKLQLFIDGQLSKESASALLTSIDSTIQLAIGALYIEPSIYHPFSGSIGIAQIYNRALTAQEVKQNFDALKSRFGL